MLLRWRYVIAAFLLSLAIVLVQVFSADQRAPRKDEFVYLTIALDIHDAGTFTDGPFAGTDQDQEKQPGRFFAPAYPYFLAWLAAADPSVTECMRCHVENRESRTRDQCPGPPISLLVVQSMLGAIGMAAIFVIALVLSRSQPVAWLTLLLALATGLAGYYTRTYLTENLAFAGFYVFLAAGVFALRERHIAAFALVGASIALATLARPSYLYLLYLVIAALLVLAVVGRGNTLIRWRDAGAFCLAATVILAPWMARNLLAFGDVAISSGYSGFILVQRVAYNAMTWGEWAVSFIYWLPDFGDSFAEAVFPEHLYARLGFNDPASFYSMGNHSLRHETISAAGGREGHLDYLLRHYVLDNLGKHLAVTIPLTLRGIWAGKYLALAGVVALVPVTLAIAKRQSILPFAFFAMSLFFMAGLHGFVSVNVVRYNIPMIALYAFVVAYAIVHIARRLRGIPEPHAEKKR